MARIKKLTIPAMSAKEFEALLVKLDACKEALEWAKGKTLRRVWATCRKGHWMEWLLRHAQGRDGVAI